MCVCKCFSINTTHSTYNAGAKMTALATRLQSAYLCAYCMYESNQHCNLYASHLSFGQSLVESLYSIGFMRRTVVVTSGMHSHGRQSPRTRPCTICETNWAIWAPALCKLCVHSTCGKCRKRPTNTRTTQAPQSQNGAYRTALHRIMQTIVRMIE